MQKQGNRGQERDLRQFCFIFYLAKMFWFYLCIHLCQPVFPEVYNQWFNSEPSYLFPGATDSGIMGFISFLQVKEILDGFSVPFVPDL